VPRPLFPGRGIRGVPSVAATLGPQRKERLPPMQIWGLHVVDLALVLVYVLVVLWLGKRAARRMTNLDEFFRR